MRSVILAVALSGALGANIAVAKQVQPPEPAEKPNFAEARMLGEREIRSTLYDPSSAQIRYANNFHWGYVNKDLKDWGWVACGFINTKNRFGGYTGEKLFAFLYKDGRTLVSYPYVRYGTTCSQQDDADIQSELLAPSSVFPPQAGGSAASIADEIAKLAALKERGIITEAEFVAGKQKLLGLDPR